MVQYSAIVVAALLVDQGSRAQVRHIISTNHDPTSRAFAFRALTQRLLQESPNSNLNTVQLRAFEELINGTHWSEVDSTLCKHYSKLNDEIEIQDPINLAQKKQTEVKPEPAEKTAQPKSKPPSRVIILDK